MVIEVDTEEALLVEIFRRLPSEVAGALTALATRLADLNPGSNITYSDSWFDEDLMVFTAASVKRLELDKQETQH